MKSRIGTTPVIIAVRSEKELPAALSSPHGVLFLLSAEIATVAEQVHVAASAGKEVYVHFDLIAGLGRDKHGLEWVAEVAQPAGIITTRGPLIAQARAVGLKTVQRTFLMDSQSMQITLEVARKAGPDFLEVMPGIAPEGIAALVKQAGRPIIGGGLVRTPAQVDAALAAGAVAVSTSAEALWRRAWGQG